MPQVISTTVYTYIMTKYILPFALFLVAGLFAPTQCLAQRSHCASGAFIKTIAIDDLVRQHKTKKAKRQRDAKRAAKKSAEKIVATKRHYTY